MDAARTKERYEVQFQANRRRHSFTDSRDKAELCARSLAKLNHAAQVIDTYTKEIVFRAAAYRQHLPAEANLPTLKSLVLSLLPPLGANLIKVFGHRPNLNRIGNKLEVKMQAGLVDWLMRPVRSKTEVRNKRSI